ncbi:integumentary mucin C.1-like [Dreissena polymorpha]|nr:integumentary mucin C.1-like [Dreissena polymorpha]
MIPSAFLVAVVFISCFYVVRCNVHSPCNATVECANSTTVCENGFCHIQAGQVCTIETATTVATTVTTTAGLTQPGATSQASSSTSASTTTPTTTATPTTTTDLTTTTTSNTPKRKKRNTGLQECVTNASCVSGEQTTLVCACNDGYTTDNGKCKKDPGNGAGPLRVTELFTVMVTTVLLFLI